MRFAFATLAALLLPLGLASGSFDPVELHARQIQPSPNVASNTTGTTAGLTPVQVDLSNGTSNVTVHGVTVNALNTTRFLGIPFAEPPMGSLRFAPPVPANLTKYAFGINATVNGPSCPQPVRALYGNSSEDCLHLNVYTPSEQSLASLRATAAALGGNNSAALTDAYESGLPVLVWIYGGAFVSGSTLPFDGSAIIAQSLATYSPVIVVTLNYRLGPWGFLAGKEAAKEGASVLGLQDQLLALKWVQQHISSFGGNPEKVTVMGESAGAISIALHLINPELVAATNGNNMSSPIGRNAPTSMNSTQTVPAVEVDSPLFRGAILQSGAMESYPLNYANESRQAYYDQLVTLTGCSNGTQGSFQCLKQVEYAVLFNASNTIQARDPSILIYGPSIDGQLIIGSPARALATGEFAKVAIIAGNVLDEGTIFVPSQVNDSASFNGFVKSAFETAASIAINDTVLNALSSYYIGSYESPYDIPDATDVTHNSYARSLAAAFGDVVFQAPRRNLQTTLIQQNITTWSYLFTQDVNATDFNGASHGSDVPLTFGAPNLTPAAYNASTVQLSRQMVSYWINFATALDPNGAKDSIVSQLVSRTLNLTSWPAYTSGQSESNMLQLEGGNLTVIQDNYRATAISYINSIPEALGH